MTFLPEMPLDLAVGTLDWMRLVLWGLHADISIVFLAFDMVKGIEYSQEVVCLSCL